MKISLPIYQIIEISLPVHREVIFKIENIISKLNINKNQYIINMFTKNNNFYDFRIDGVNTICYISFMPNQPDPDKRLYALRIPRTLFARLKKEAAIRKMSIKDYILEILIKETINTPLTANDYEEITRETRKAESRRNNTR